MNLIFAFVEMMCTWKYIFTEISNKKLINKAMFNKYTNLISQKIY